MNGTVLGLLNQAYLDPGWGSDTPVRHLVADFPDLGDLETEMIEATKRARSSHYLQHLLDRSLHPLTVRNAERYPMLDRALRRIAGPNGSR